MISYVDKGLPVIIITVFVLCVFGGLWFAFPIARRGGPLAAAQRRDDCPPDNRG